VETHHYTAGVLSKLNRLEQAVDSLTESHYTPPQFEQDVKLGKQKGNFLNKLPMAPISTLKARQRSFF
jgi:hypothetical protein